MKKITAAGLFVMMLIFAGVQMCIAQSSKAESLFKNHINEVVHNVKKAEQPLQKRELLNSSFDKLISVLDKVEAMKNLSEDDHIALNNFRQNISDKKNELNGLNGFIKVHDTQLNNFADYVQQDFEQANPFLIGAAIGGFFALLFLLMTS